MEYTPQAMIMHSGSEEMISFLGNPSNNVDAIRFRDIFHKKATSRLTVSILAIL